jgi:hypothetical protein
MLNNVTEQKQHVAEKKKLLLNHFSIAFFRDLKIKINFALQPEGIS